MEVTLGNFKLENQTLMSSNTLLTAEIHELQIEAFTLRNEAKSQNDRMISIVGSNEELVS